MTLRFLKTALAVIGAGLIAVPSLAQDYANESGAAIREEREDRIANDEIVVTGQAEEASGSQIHRQARDIAEIGNVRAVSLARFEQPICPGIAGLTTPTAQLMIDRIRENARFVDLRVLPDGCNPNFVVAFVDDGQAFLTQMVEESPARFQWMSSVAKREMLAPGPVHVWTDVQPASRDGMPIARGRNLASPPTMSNWVSHSRIYLNARNDIITVWVIIDRDAARGLSLEQLADYATMRGLVQTEPPEDFGISSVLGVFNEDGPWPPRLTDFDRAYLASVYQGLSNMPAFFKLGRVATELRDIEDAREEERLEQASADSE